MLLATSCRSESIFDDAVAVWSFSDLNDQAGENSMLKSHGEVPIVNLKGNKAAQFDGSAWLDAGQGAGNELNLTGKEVTLYTRVKASVVNGYSPVITKAGNDQNLAYSIEVKMGSDEIAGTHLLKHKLPEDEINGWQDILFRFNGKRSELYVNGILRDDEVTVGQIRDWNCRPLLIGAQYKQPDGYAEAAKNEVEATFKGLIDLVALWDKWLPVSFLC